MLSISKSVGYNCPEPILIVFGKSSPYVFCTVVVVRDGKVIEFKKEPCV